MIHEQNTMFPYFIGIVLSPADAPISGQIVVFSPPIGDFFRKSGNFQENWHFYLRFLGIFQS